MVVVAVYLIGGAIYQRLVVGAKGMEQIPNYSFWQDFGNLQAVSVASCYVFEYWETNIRNTEAAVRGRQYGPRPSIRPEKRSFEGHIDGFGPY